KNNIQHITPSQLRLMYDDIVYQLKMDRSQNVYERNLHILYDIVNVLEDVDGQILIDSSLINHEFYAKLRDILREILRKWHRKRTDVPLTKQESFIFRNTSKILLNMTHSVNDQTDRSVMNELLLNEQFIESIKDCLEDVALHGKYLNDKNLKHFDRLIDVLADYQRQNK
ncbi:unnamed protein product, partial [Didymodactylos carnosus]